MLYRVGSETSFHVCNDRKKLIKKYQKMPIAIYEHDGNFNMKTKDHLYIPVKYCPLCGATILTEQYEEKWGTTFHEINELYDPSLEY